MKYPRTTTSENIAKRVFLWPNHLLIKPFLVAALEQDQAIGLEHQRPGLVQKFFELNGGNLTFKHRILYPVQITPAQLKHFCHAAFIDVIYQYYIHLPPDLERPVFLHLQNMFAEFVALKFHEVLVAHVLLQHAVPNRLGQPFFPCPDKRLLAGLF